MAPSALNLAQLMYIAVLFIILFTCAFKHCKSTINANFTVIVIPMVILCLIQIFLGLIEYRQSYDPLTNPTLEQVLSFITAIIYIGHGIWYLIMTYHLPKIFQPKDTLYAIPIRAIYTHRLGMILLMTFRIIDVIAKVKDVKISNLSLDIFEIIIVSIGYFHMVWLLCQRLHLFIPATTLDDTEPRRTMMEGVMIIVAVVSIYTITSVSMPVAITVRIIMDGELYSSILSMIHWRILTVFTCYFWFYVALMLKMSDKIYQRICSVYHDRSKSLYATLDIPKPDDAAFLV